MKKLIASLSVLILLVLSYGIAAAAPAPTQVTVVNTSANPVPTNVQQRPAQVIFSGTFTTSPPDTVIDTSLCSQIRITASIDKAAAGTSSVSLWDQSTPTLIARIFDASLSNSTVPYASGTLDTPGTSLTLTLAVTNGDTLSVRVYCR